MTRANNLEAHLKGLEQIICKDTLKITSIELIFKVI